MDNWNKLAMILNSNRIRACVRCGFCCKQGPCPYGDWQDNNIEKGCKFLAKSASGYSCSIFEDIQKDPLAHVSPAFGAGCCGAINEHREAIVARLGEEVFVDV